MADVLLAPERRAPPISKSGSLIPNQERLKVLFMFHLGNQTSKTSGDHVTVRRAMTAKWDGKNLRFWLLSLQPGQFTNYLPLVCDCM